MKTLKKSLVFIVVFILGSINIANAQINYPQRPDWALYDEHGNEWVMPPKHGQVLYDKNGKKVIPPPKPDINLSKEQITKMNKWRQDAYNKAKPIFNEIKYTKYKIREIYEDPDLSKTEKNKKIEPLIEKLKKLYAKADDIRTADFERFQSILTEEQKKKLREFEKANNLPPPPIRKKK